MSRRVANHAMVMEYLQRAARKDEKDLTGIAKKGAREQTKPEHTFALNFLVLVFVVVVLYGSFFKCCMI